MAGFIRNKMTKEQRKELMADRMSLAMYCYGLYNLGHDIDYIMHTELIKESGLDESQVKFLTFETGPKLTLALGI